MRIFIIFLLSQFVGLSVKAQFVQKGVTMEYNRSRSKTVYMNPVSIIISNAEPSVSINGSFVLTFMKSVKAGDTIASPEIKIGDEQYVLFNRSRIQGWVLSPQKQMEVLVCKKEIIDDLESTYTNNYVNQLKKKYEQMEKQLRESTDDKENLEKELTKLKVDYDRDVSMIRARAVLFAYVDETEKDSLELLRRECILNNDLERAWKVGEEMNLGGMANSYMENVKKSRAAYEQNLQDLLECATMLEEHIQICESEEFDDKEELTKSYYKSLTEIYKTLLDEMRFSDNDKKMRDDLKKKLGRLLCKEEKYEEAVNIGYLEALWYLSSSGFRSYEERRKYALTLLDSLKRHDYIFDLPDYTGYTSNEAIIEDCESFPDFGIQYAGFILFYHILDNNEVSIVHCQEVDSLVNHIKVPEKVRYHGQTYTVTKIGKGAFLDDEGNTEKAIFQRDSSYCENYSIVENFYGPPLPYPNPYRCDGYRQLFYFTKVTLPNTIRYIGRSAFGVGRYFYQGEEDTEPQGVEVNFPKSLKVIRVNALSGVEYKKGIVEIPEGVEVIEDAWGFSERFLSFSIPSTARTIEAFRAPYRYSPKIKDIKLSAQNKNFTLINNILYTADSTEVYLGSISSTKVSHLFIPKNLTTNIFSIVEDVWDKDILPSHIDSIYADRNNPRYSTLDGILYDKNFETLILKPKKMKKINVPATLNDIGYYRGGYYDSSSWSRGYYRFGDSSYSGSHYIFPKEIDPDMFVEILAEEAREDTITLEFYGIKSNIRSDNDAEKIDNFIKYITTILEENPNNSNLIYIKGLLHLELFDTDSATAILQRKNWECDSIKEELRTRIESTKHLADSLRYLIDYALENLAYSSYERLIEWQEKFAKSGTDNDIYKLALLYYLKGTRDRGDENSEKDCEKAIVLISNLTKGDSVKRNNYLSDLYLETAILYYNESISEYVDIIDKNLELSLIANPDNISSIEVTGLMHLYKNEFEEANKMLEKIQTIDEEYANNSTLKKELEKNNK